MKIEIGETPPLYRRWDQFLRRTMYRGAVDVKLWRAYGGWYEMSLNVSVRGSWSAIERRRDEVYGER